MTPELWEQILHAYKFIKGGGAEKLEGHSWSVYRVGTVIRIDIKE